MSPSSFCGVARPSHAHGTAQDSDVLLPARSQSVEFQSHPRCAYFSLMGKTRLACGVWVCGRGRRYGEEDAAASERSEPTLLPATPRPPGLCSSDWNLREMKITAWATTHTLLVPTYYYYFFNLQLTMFCSPAESPTGITTNELCFSPMSMSINLLFPFCSPAFQPRNRGNAHFLKQSDDNVHTHQVCISEYQATKASNEDVSHSEG